MPTLPPPSTNFPASGFDRCDGGLTNTNGTLEPTGALNAGGAVGYNFAKGYSILQEMSDSPQIESAEQSTIIHRFHCDYNTAQILLIDNPRGTVSKDSNGYLYRVLPCKIDSIAKSGNYPYNRPVIFTVTSEAMSFGQPPDEFSVEIVELNPSAEKHPRYAILSYAQRYAGRNADVSDDIDMTQAWNNVLSQAVGGITGSAYAPAFELLLKKHKGEDSFYMSGYKVEYSRYFWLPQIINPGGYIEDPVGTSTQPGLLPSQFWSTDGTPTGTSIFSATALYNQNMFPQTGSLANYPYGLSWLRQTDHQVLNRTWYRMTYSWLGSPLGNWDAQWYSQTFQPYQTQDTQGSVVNH